MCDAQWGCSGKWLRNYVQVEPSAGSAHGLLPLWTSAQCDSGLFRDVLVPPNVYSPVAVFPSRCCARGVCFAFWKVLKGDVLKSAVSLCGGNWLSLTRGDFSLCSAILPLLCMFHGLRDHWCCHGAHPAETRLAGHCAAVARRMQTGCCIGAKC